MFRKMKLMSNILHSVTQYKIPYAVNIELPGQSLYHYPDSKIQGANTGPFWDRQDPDGPQVDPMNLAIRVNKIKNNVMF